MWIKNAWYVAAWGEEVQQEKVLARTLLDEHVAFYRQKTDDSVVALLDMCPHRFAPLSKGCVEGDSITCMYHGLEFGKSGKCLKNPMGPTPAALRVKSYTTFEQDGLVWIWMGDREADDVSVIPRIPHHTDTSQRWVSGYTFSKSDYRLFVDNLMDLSHTHTLHPGLGGRAYVPKVKSWENEDGSIVTDHLIENMANFLDPASNSTVTHRDNITWFKPATHILNSRTLLPDGSEVFIPSAHILTPASSSETHYFWSSGTASLDPDQDEVMLEVLDQAFNKEDKPMVEGVQSRMAGRELWGMKPVLLPNDVGMVRVRRRYEQLISAENSEQ